MIKREGSFYKNVEICFCDCDFKKRAKIHTILKLMADIAGDAYGSSCLTHDELWERGFVFLLTKISVHIERIPMTGEHIDIETWEQGQKGTQYIRSFAFYDEKGDSIIEAQTTWVLVNPNTRSIVRPADFTGSFNPIPDRIPNVAPAGKIRPVSELADAGERKVVFSDLDQNGHVYNAVYSSIACDFLPFQMMENDISDFKINFKKEAVIGDVLNVKTAVCENKATVAGYLGEDVSFECEFTFREI